MFIGAPLLVAQVGSHNIRKMLNDGDRSTLQDMRLDTRGTTAQFLKALREAPLLQILERINPDRYKKLREGLLQQADDLDFLQTVVTSVHDAPALNPTMNAITDAFNRRRFVGRFRTAGRGIEMDTLLYQSTKGVKDDDDVTSLVGNTARPSQRTRYQTGGKPQHCCYAFQSGSCHRGSLCTYPHKCLICNSYEHGANSCDRRRQSGDATSRSETDSRPPNPRRRQDRASSVNARPPEPRRRRERADNADRS